VAVVIPKGRLLTIDDLDRFPNDGNRYELIEGSLHVTPSPIRPHQEGVANVFRLIDRAAPPDLTVLFAPMDVVLGPATVLQPDILVFRVAEQDYQKIWTTPLLTVEVLSPSTRLYDLSLKLEVYRTAGVGSYWVVDTENHEVQIWDWSGDEPVEHKVSGDDELTVTFPFEVTIRPSAL
jgi:Uma2 family endonuclease